METWKSLYWLKNYDHYEVSSLGEIRNSKKGNVLKGSLYKGYRRVFLHSSVDYQPFYAAVHRLVATAFIGFAPSESHQVNHIDGNKSNNRADNLEWLLPKENRQHAIDNNLHHRGEAHKGSKLTEAQVIEIITSSEPPNSLAEKFLVSTGLISLIKRGRRWSWLYEKINNQS